MCLKTALPGRAVAVLRFDTPKSERSGDRR